MSSANVLRPVRDDDAKAVIELITAVFNEYPGCVMDVEGEMPELLALASHFQQAKGEMWIAERAGTVVGCAGYHPKTGGVELKKLYVAREARGQGIGAALLIQVEEAARRKASLFIEAWSDTRFTTAHAFYKKRGFSRDGRTRALHDKSATIEYYFRKDLGRATGKRRNSSR